MTQHFTGRAKLTAAALLLLGLCSGAQLSRPSGASAQEPSASERALARRAFHQGMTAARAERWEDARVAFERAWELVHRPRVLLNLATAQVHTGRLVEGAENYRRYVRENRDGADARLLREARQRLSEVEARTPQLTLRVTSLRPDDELMLDGAPVSRAVLSAPLPVNPGRHVLRVLREGAAVAEAEVTLDVGAEQSLRLEVPAPTRAATAGVPGPAQAARDGAPPETSAGLLEGPGAPEHEGGGVLRSPWFWIAIGLVVAGGVTAGVVLTRDSGRAPFTGNAPPGFLVVR